MSNHFTGLSLGSPLDDQRLDLTDLYAFQSPSDSTKTVLILNANPPCENGFHPEGIYRINIDNNEDLLADIAISYVFSEMQNGKQTVSVLLAKGDDARSAEAIGEKIIADIEVSFGREPKIIHSGDYTFFCGRRSDAFVFDFGGLLNLFDIEGGRNFTAPHLGGKAPWTGTDTNLEADVFSIVIELPTSQLCSNSTLNIWGRCSVYRDGELTHADRAGHPSVSSLFNTDETKEEYNASEPVNDRKRWLEHFKHLMGHTGNYTPEEATDAIDKEGTLPDVLRYNPAQPAAYPNGRFLSDDVLNYRLSFISKGEIPHDGLSARTSILNEFPYLGTPYMKISVAAKGEQPATE